MLLSPFDYIPQYMTSWRSGNKHTTHHWLRYVKMCCGDVWYADAGRCKDRLGRCLNGFPRYCRCGWAASHHIPWVSGTLPCLGKLLQTLTTISQRYSSTLLRIVRSRHHCMAIHCYSYLFMGYLSWHGLFIALSHSDVFHIGKDRASLKQSCQVCLTQMVLRVMQRDASSWLASEPCQSKHWFS